MTAMTHFRRRGYYPGGSAGGAHYEYPTLGGRASSPTVASGRRRLPSLSSLSSARTGERSQSSSYVVTRRTGQGRRLPATPAHPSTLNIDALGNVSSSQQKAGSAVGGSDPPRGPVGCDRINFPKLDPSPSRSAIRTGGGVVSSRVEASAVSSLRQVPPSGRGGSGRQLPRVGPEQLDSAGISGVMGRGGASSGGTRRELPRPGTTIGFR